MREKIILVFVVGLVFFTGCTSKQEQYEQLMEEYAKQYYEQGMKQIEGLTVPEVSIKDLKNVNKQGQSYDLSELESCSDDSYVKIILKEGTKEIESFEHHLSCGKRK